MIERELPILPAREWLEAANAMFMPIEIAPRFRPRDWSFEPFIAHVEDVWLLLPEWIVVSGEGQLLIQGMHPSLDLRRGKSPYFELTDGKSARIRYPRAEARIDEPMILIGNRGGHWHWITDYLPRMLAIGQHPELAGVPIVVGDDLSGVQAESLAILGVSADRVRRLSAGHRYLFRSVWIPSVLTDGLTPHPAAIKWLRRTYRRAQADPTDARRIFVSRADAKVRRLRNEAEVFSALRPLGFEHVIASNLGFQAQVDLFAAAQAVVGPTGSGLSNTIFSRPNIAIVEIHNHASGADFIEHTAKALGQRYRRVSGTTLAAGDTFAHDLDFTADPDEVAGVTRVLLENASVK